MESLFTIVKYQPEFEVTWNGFIATCKNATFLHHRSFMDYHSDRFLDHSMMFYKGKQLAAVLPANRVKNKIYSHQGLTYGGFLLSRKLKLVDTLSLIQEFLRYLENQGIRSLFVKQMPSFYAQQPSEEMEYLLQLVKAQVYRVDSASVINLNDRLSIQSNRIEGVKKARKIGLTVKQEGVFKNFWETILLPNLKNRHNSRPTHTLSEIELLHARFPNNIKQFNVYKEDLLVGGATIFETDTTAHAQYISADNDKQELGTLDFLFHQLITETFSRKRYFDFGISNENQGRQLNQGLSYWKECFGARTFVHRFYEVETENHSLLNDVLI